MAVSDMLQRGELQSDKIKLGAARVAQSVDGVFLMRFLESSSRVIKGKGHRYSGLKCNVSVYSCLNVLVIKGVFPVVNIKYYYQLCWNS